MKNIFVTALLLGTIPTALAGGAGTPAPLTFICNDGTMIKPTYKPDSVLLTVTKGKTVERYELEALRPNRYGDAEHTWIPKGKTAEFAIGAAGNKVLTCRAK